VDLKNKAVTIGDDDTLPYEKLILAPGGTPRRLPFECAGIENVFTFRDITDATDVVAGW